MINESMARRLFEKENPLGKQIYAGANKEQIFEIVGVVKDAKIQFSARTIPLHYLYAHISRLRMIGE